MTASGPAELAEIFSALANPRRIEIMQLLLEEYELSVNAMASGIGLSQSATSQHLARLREAGLVRTTRKSTVVFYSLFNRNSMKAFIEATKDIDDVRTIVNEMKEMDAQRARRALS